MKRIDSVIVQYLKDNKRLIIPSLGAFIRKDNGEVVFMEYLRKDDGVLAGRVMATYPQLTAGQYSALLERYIADFRQGAATRKGFAITALGTLHVDTGGMMYLEHDPSVTADKTITSVPAKENVVGQSSADEEKAAAERGSAEKKETERVPTEKPEAEKIAAADKESNGKGLTAERSAAQRTATERTLAEKKEVEKRISEEKAVAAAKAESEKRIATEKATAAKPARIEATNAESRTTRHTVPQPDPRPERQPSTRPAPRSVGRPVPQSRGKGAMNNMVLIIAILAAALALGVMWFNLSGEQPVRFDLNPRTEQQQ